MRISDFCGQVLILVLLTVGLLVLAGPKRRRAFLKALATVGLIGIAVLIYIASPVDLAPDFLPVVGQADDLVVGIVGAVVAGVVALRAVVQQIFGDFGKVKEVVAEKEEAGD